MMKRVFFQLFFIISIFSIIQGYSWAVTIVDSPYSSSCSASVGDSWDDGDTYAVAYGGNAAGIAEARADGWNIGTRTETKFDENYSLEEYYASADFSQTFKVTASGPASITFAWSGELWFEVYDPSDEFGVSTYTDIGIEDSLGNNHSEYYELESDGDETYSDSVTFTYDFSDEDVGSEFFLDVYMTSGISGEGIEFNPTGYLNIGADFYDSLEITEITGGIAPVPVPGAIWLLTGGLAGLVAIRRRK